MVVDGKYQMSWDEVDARAFAIAKEIGTLAPGEGGRILTPKVFGIPNGGVYAAMAVQSAAEFTVELVEDPTKADFFVDDIIDSGKTKAYFLGASYRMPNHNAVPFLALVDKQGQDKEIGWVVFPWERMGLTDPTGIESSITRILQYIGEDVDREGLLETPERVVRSYSEIFSGYKQDPAAVLKTFVDGACDEMVVLKDIEFYSTCEHHMQPFFGKAHIAYIPDGKVIGVSKLARLLEVYSRRLQIQERLTEQVTLALEDHLKPKGAACVIEAKHFCMVCRGVQKQNSVMVTSSLRGVFREPAVRQEFLNFIR